MEDKMKKCCPNCSQQYRVNNISSKAKANLPLFLPCGHSMCETCIVNILKCMEPIECKVCHQDVDVKPNNMLMLDINKSKLYEMFPVNVLMVGEMVVENMQDTKPHNKDDDDHFIDLKRVLSNSEQTQGQCLECHNTTSMMCQQCATILCDSCFNKTHRNFIIFKNHQLQNIASAMTSSNNCKTHKEKTLDYYCKDCEKSICMDCMMVGGEKSCKNHDVVSMQEVNETILEDLAKITPQVDENFRRLTKTAVDIGYLLYNFENDNGPAADINKIVAAIEQHFSKLYSLVQKHKDEVIDIVIKLKNSEKKSLLAAKADVTSALKKAKKTLNSIKSTTDEKQLKQLNLAILLEDAKDIAEMPWYLYKEDVTKDSIKVTVNEDICSLITDYIQLEGNVNSDYKLCTPKELGENVEIPAAPSAPVYPPELPKDVRQKTQKPKVEKEPPAHKGPTLYKEAPRYRMRSGSVSSLNSSSSDKSNLSFVTQNDTYHRPPVNPVSPFTESQHPKQLREGCQELIYISHIVDPHNLYVQRACHQSLVKDMLRDFRNAVSLPKPSVNHITQGKMYLAFNKIDNMWQRCRVVSIDRKDANQPLFQVFCFDFGSTETVNVNKLRLLPPARVQSPYPLALNCSIANCKPKNGTWSSDDSFLIQNITDNKQAVIHVRNILSTSNSELKLDCDVTTVEYGVSLAHALVFHERAIMPNPKMPYPRITIMKDKPKLFMNRNDFKPQAVEEVHITHIVSPDKFYVRKRHLQKVYEKLCEDMEHEYSLTSQAGTVYLPENGMVCAVNVEKHQSSAEDGAWARGVVTELPGRGRVRVFLPDSGLTLLVHWTALRHIHTKFTTLHALSTECHLAGITPLHKKWSPGSVALLQKYESQLLELHVEDNRENRGQCSVGVALYDNTNEENIVCINNEMIKHKYAVSFGIYMFNKDTNKNQVLTNKSPYDKPKPRPEIKENKSQIKIMKRKEATPKINEKELEAKDKGPLRLEAKVLHYQSPSLIYVSLVQQLKTFNELFEKMQKHFSKKKTQGKEHWQVEDRCCTLCVQSQTWRRAVILEIDGDNAKVFYSDFACVETVPLANLTELTPEFSKIGDAAIKVHLSGVIPAVGEEWPSLTKEYLKELLDAYKFIFITKVGNFKKDKSMPVEIWVYHTVQGEALEPNKSEWRCLNKKIIEQGLGIPDKSQEVANAEGNADQPDDMLSFLNVTGSVNEWLQLEPMPMVPMKTSDDKPEASSPVESDENEHMGTSSNVMYISDWLPSEPLPAKEFTALPTYIDNDGVIFLHDITQQDTLDLIRKALDVRFQDPDPKAKFAKWTVGEPCIAQFFLDNRFYRGRVMQVNKENSTCLIHYVDYGNEEICKFENMRKSIALHQIPIQAHKCVLNRIRPIGKQWDRQTLDYIHKSIVEKQCYVKVADEEMDGISRIELKFDKLWINDHLVDFEMAEYTDGSKATIKKYVPVSKIQETVVVEEDSDAGLEYIIEDDPDTIDPLSTSHDSVEIEFVKGIDWNIMLDEDDLKCLSGSYLTFPKISDDVFKCNIQVINDLNLLELSVIFEEDETNNVYEQLFEEVQAESANMPPLDGIFENKACVALFPEDGLWYRASIMQYSESTDQIKVRYVDYGNIEVISCSNAREINLEWVKLPPATIAAKLHGLRINPEADTKVIAQEFQDIFLDKGPFYAKIMCYDSHVPSVELNNDTGELVYETLVAKKLFLKED